MQDVTAVDGKSNAQWYGPPATTPTPETFYEFDTWSWTAMNAPELMPDVVRRDLDAPS